VTSGVATAIGVGLDALLDFENAGIRGLSLLPARVNGIHTRLFARERLQPTRLQLSHGRLLAASTAPRFHPTAQWSAHKRAALAIVRLVQSSGHVRIDRASMAYDGAAGGEGGSSGLQMIPNIWDPKP
jgi:hypothetical protein